MIIYIELKAEGCKLKARPYLTKLEPRRNYLNTEVLTSVVSSLERRLSAYGLTTEMQRFKVEAKEYSNLIATLNADRPTRVIVGAHMGSDVFGLRLHEAMGLHSTSRISKRRLQSYS